MSAIRLSFVCGSDISSRLIAWYGNGYGGFSHVDSMLPDGSLLGARSDRIGQIPPGVQIRPDNYERWTRRSVVEIPATELRAIAWETWLRKQIGRPYDIQAIWGFVLGERKHGEGRWICSACAFESLEQVNLLKPTPVPAAQITPDSLFELVTAGLGGRIVHSVGA